MRGEGEDMNQRNKWNEKGKRSQKALRFILVGCLVVMVAFLGACHKKGGSDPVFQDSKNGGNKNTGNKPTKSADGSDQEDMDKAARSELVNQAKRFALGYDYERALKLIESYGDEKDDFKQYKELLEEYNNLEKEKASLELYGGEYKSITEINHIFFHSLIADNAKAFDGDAKTRGYNMYMTTISEFNKMMDKMYQDGYVLVKMSDLVQQKTLEDGTTKYIENPIYLRKGKKPFVLSQDDVNYYKYMDNDGFAKRIVIGKDKKPTCEMLMEDGSYKNGPFDIVPILDAFVEEHPDFSYKGAKGLLALTGYEGVLGYRTNNTASPTYEKDKEEVKKVVKVLKSDGWEFASHTWGHKDMYKISYEHLKRDTNRWLSEVGSLIGPTDILVFPYGIDIEKTIGNYRSNKYQFLKKSGFNYYIGVNSKPWMQIRKNYIRMERRPLDGQAMLQFPERLKDLFDVSDIMDRDRPQRNW